ASNLRAPWRALSVLIMIAVLATSLVLVTPLGASATASHAKRHMPNVVGLARARVYAVMRADALYFVTRGPGSANATWKEVVAQSPRAGTVVPWHFQATLTTSTRSPHGPRRVPRVLGLSRARTFAAVARAGLYFTTRGPGSSDGKWRVVLRQTPRAGTRVRWHATISLVVSTVLAKAKTKPRPKKPVRVTTTTRAPVTKKPKPSCVPESTSTTSAPTTTTPTTSTTTSTLSTSTTTPDETTTTTGATPTTTTTICKVPVTTTTLKPKKPKRYRYGDATWYSYTPGHCATWYLPMGTRVTVRDLKTGKVVHCVVTDREGAHGNRVVDLDETQFAQLAPLAQGVVVVKVSW
ncbi:MAG: PASTA domain-containing protein, partial [Acidimicrobiales bacterium]